MEFKVIPHYRLKEGDNVVVYIGRLVLDSLGSHYSMNYSSDTYIATIYKICHGRVYVEEHSSENLASYGHRWACRYLV